MDEVLEAVAHGIVQGVGFRWFAQREASLVGLTGWVANEPDGSVRCLAIGPGPALDAFADRLREGPSGAQIDRLDLDRRPWNGESFAGFGIRSGAHRGD
jgi:acylphosphatase